MESCDSCDLPAMACVYCPHGIEMEPLHPFGRYGFLYRDKKEVYMVLQFPKNIKRFHEGLSPSCKLMCNRPQLRRWHLGCLGSFVGLGCRLRMRVQGKIPKRFAVTPVMLYIRKDRPLAVVKDRIVRTLLTVAELFAA